MRILLFLTAVLSCVLGANTYQQVIPAIKTANYVEKPSSIQDAKFDREKIVGALAKVEWWDETDPSNPEYLGSGSAWCISRSDDKSLWVSCQHVLDNQAPGLVAKLLYVSRQLTQAIGSVYDIHVSKKYDVGYFLSDAIPFSILEIADKEEVKAIKDNEVVFAAGSPNGLFPPFITIGYVMYRFNGDIYHNAATWFGNSGGALISAKTGRVIGMTYRIYIAGTPRGPKADSGRGIALEIWQVSEFIEEESKKKQ